MADKVIGFTLLLNGTLKAVVNTPLLQQYKTTNIIFNYNYSSKMLYIWIGEDVDHTLKDHLKELEKFKDEIINSEFEITVIKGEKIINQGEEAKDFYKHIDIKEEQFEKRKAWWNEFQAAQRAKIEKAETKMNEQFDAKNYETAIKFAEFGIKYAEPIDDLAKIREFNDFIRKMHELMKKRDEDLKNQAELKKLVQKLNKSVSSSNLEEIKENLSIVNEFFNSTIKSKPTPEDAKIISKAEKRIMELEDEIKQKALRQEEIKNETKILREQITIEIEKGNIIKAEENIKKLEILTEEITIEENINENTIFIKDSREQILQKEEEIVVELKTSITAELEEKNVTNIKNRLNEMREGITKFCDDEIKKQSEIYIEEINEKLKDIENELAKIEKTKNISEEVQTIIESVKKDKDNLDDYDKNISELDRALNLIDGYDLDDLEVEIIQLKKDIIDKKNDADAKTKSFSEQIEKIIEKVDNKKDDLENFDENISEITRGLDISSENGIDEYIPKLNDLKSYIENKKQEKDELIKRISAEIKETIDIVENNKDDGEEYDKYLSDIENCLDKSKEFAIEEYNLKLNELKEYIESKKEEADAEAKANNLYEEIKKKVEEGLEHLEIGDIEESIDTFTLIKTKLEEV